MKKNTTNNAKGKKRPAASPAAPIPAQTKKRFQWLTGLLPDADRRWAVAAVVAFAISCYVLLVSCYSLYMQKIEALTLYMGTSAFYESCMTVPGGAVNWLAACLTQTLASPSTGALVITSLLTASLVLTIRTFRMSARLAPVAVILPVLMLLAFTNLGYLIFTLKPNGFALSLSVGVLIVLVLYGIYTLLRRWWWLQAVFIALTVIVGYHPLGFYALTVALMCGGSNILQAYGDTAIPPKWRWLIRCIPFVVALAATSIVPEMWYKYVGGQLMPSQTYITPLPRFYSHESSMKMLYSSVFILLGFGAFVSPLLGRKVSRRWPLVVCAAALLCLPVCRYNDRDFNTTLQLDHALWNQDWPAAAEIAKTMPGPTTRVNTVLGYVALMRTGEAGDRMFAINYGWEPYNTTRGGSAFNDAASYLLAYHLGMPNYAYRWGTEYAIAQSMSPERMKIMAKCALLNYDLDLAKTYLDLLYNIPAHREWARKYLHYQSHPMEIGSDPEMHAIKQLMYNPNFFINDGGAVEGYVWPLLAQGMGGTPEYNELCMQAALICRDLDAFVAKLPGYLQTHQSLPVHYQEAALLWAKLGNHPYPAPVSPEIERRHDDFLQAFRQTSMGEAEGQRDLLKPQFGSTYWFYFVFNDDKEVK